MLTLALLLAAAPQTTPPPVVDTAPAGTPLAPPPPREALTTWQVGEVRCDGEVAAPVRMVRPYAAMGWSSSGVTASTFQFRIDASGRPVDISPGGPYGEASDLAPALAASRFPAGTERRNCSVTFSAERTPIGQARVADVMGYTLFPLGSPSRAAWERVRRPGDCVDPPPALRNRAYPDFEAIAQTPGTSSWSMIGHDIDARGRPVNVRVVEGTGNAALDRASIAAVKASRFGPGKRTGCLYPYWRRGAALPAPIAPDRASVRPATADCPTDINWLLNPVLSYPEPFRRRSIEGWALIGYDLAPWGQPGNVHVLAAAPAAAFGEQGMNTVRAATTTASAHGYTGCVEMVRFVMGKPGMTASQVEPPPPF